MKKQDDIIKQLERINGEKKGGVNFLSIALVISLALAVVKLIGLMTLTWFQVFIPVFIVLGFSFALVLLIFLLLIVVAIVGSVSKN